MLGMSRQTPGVPSGAAGALRIRWLTVAAVVLLASGTAAAQAPATSPPPPLESGDTAPPPGAPVPPPAAAPVTPVPSAAAPAPTVESPLFVPVSPLSSPPPAQRQRHIYEEHWFWGAIGVLVVTGAVVLALSLANGDPTTPNTRLGDMRAF
jgi:hypothetical protein